MQLITSARTPAANLSARTPALADRLEAWGATFLFGMFKFLPLVCASALGGALARRIGPFLSASTQARRNISRAFPGLSETQIAGVVGSMWDNLGRLAAEYSASTENPCLRSGRADRDAGLRTCRSGGRSWPADDFLLRPPCQL